MVTIEIEDSVGAQLVAKLVSVGASDVCNDLVTDAGGLAALGNQTDAGRSWKEVYWMARWPGVLAASGMTTDSPAVSVPAPSASKMSRVTHKMHNADVKSTDSVGTWLD